MLQSYSLWNESFEQRSQVVFNLRVKDCMCTPGFEVCVLEGDLLEVAIHKLATGRRQSLLVTGGDEVVGILRLADIFEQLSLGCADRSE